MKLASFLQRKKIEILLAFVFASVMLLSTTPSFAQKVDLSGCKSTVAFSPNGGGTELVIETINSAKTEIRMATYSFTEPRIAKALLQAKKRGVDVSLVVDTDHNGRKTGPSAVSFLIGEGIPITIQSSYKIQHNKFIVVDRKTVETGSFNYSRAADQSNAENLMSIASCPQLAAIYLKDWEKLKRGDRHE